MGAAELTPTSENRNLDCQPSETTLHRFQLFADRLSNLEQRDCPKTEAAFECDERRFQLFAAEFAEWLAILTPTSVEALRTLGKLDILIPRNFPPEWPAWISRGFTGDPEIFTIHAIPDLGERAEAILSAGVVDIDEVSRALIESVLCGPWPGPLAAGLLRPMPEDQALATSLEANREYFAREGRRILRSMRLRSPLLLMDFRRLRFPHLVDRRECDRPSLLSVLDELEERQ